MNVLITPQMKEDAKHMLQLLGVPVVQAPCEAEVLIFYFFINIKNYLVIILHIYKSGPMRVALQGRESIRHGYRRHGRADFRHMHFNKEHECQEGARVGDKF